MRVNQGAGFALEPIAELRIGGEPFGEYFDRDRAIQPRVPRFVDLAHPSAAQQRQDFIRAEMSTGGQRHAMLEMN